jgi:hypothetical protein
VLGVAAAVAPVFHVAGGPDPAPAPVAASTDAFAGAVAGADDPAPLEHGGPDAVARDHPVRADGSDGAADGSGSGVHGGEAPRPEPHLLVRVPRDLRLTARPGGGRTVGTVPSGSRFYDVPTVAWVQEVDPSGRFGRLAVPYAPGGRSGWLRITNLPTQTTWVRVHVDLSDRVLQVYRRDRLLMRSRIAIGAPGSPTPRGRYFVTDRVAFPEGHTLGRFAFGLSGIQHRLPAGWSGGDQLAIHGTNDPGSIGQAASAGCVRVPAGILQRLKPLLHLGTPVIVAR